MASVADDWRSNHAWREDYVFWTARGVSKTGTFEPHNEVLVELGRVLTRDEALWLYAQVRDRSRRGEGEWRAEFLWLFPQLGPSDLPPLPPGEQHDDYPRPPPPPPLRGPLPDAEVPF